MDLDRSTLLPALNFMCGVNDHICRLCFVSTELEEVSLENDIHLQNSYYDGTVTIINIFQELGISEEKSLPQVLCMNCATMAINAYLFRKLYQYSQNQWLNAFTKFSISLDQVETVNPNVRTAYITINQGENFVYTSKKVLTSKSKRVAIMKLKEVFKTKKAYVKVKTRSRVVCEECGDRFNSERHLLKHTRIHSKAKYPCDHCHKLFGSQAQVDEHAERIHYPKKLHCPKCSKKFSTEKMLKYHDNLYHVEATCKLCSIQFPSKKELRAHLDKHEANKCPKCNKTFLNKYTFKFHLKICGNCDARVPQFFCDICNKSYVRKNGIRSHLKIDHGFGQVLTCNWCDKKFDAVSRLRNHMVKHTRERNYICVHCGGKFVTPAALLYHTRLHTGEKPFPCDECGESFLSASRRMEHKRRKHIGPTRECPVCHMKFVMDHQLRKHLQRHYNPQSKLFVPEADMSYAKVLAQSHTKLLKSDVSSEFMPNENIQYVSTIESIPII